MIITLFSGTKFIVSKERWREIKKAIDQGATVINLGDQQFTVSAMSDVIEGGYDAIDFPALIEREKKEKLMIQQREGGFSSMGQLMEGRE